MIVAEVVYEQVFLFDFGAIVRFNVCNLLLELKVLIFDGFPIIPELFALSLLVFELANVMVLDLPHGLLQALVTLLYL